MPTHVSAGLGQLPRLSCRRLCQRQPKAALQKAARRASKSKRRQLRRKRLQHKSKSQQFLHRESLRRGTTADASQPEDAAAGPLPAQPCRRPPTGRRRARFKTAAHNSRKRRRCCVSSRPPRPAAVAAARKCAPVASRSNGTEGAHRGPFWCVRVQRRPLRRRYIRERTAFEKRQIDASLRRC